MSNAKVGTKTKMKDDKAKSSMMNGDEPDRSLLRKPVQTSITGFAQARKIFETATEELKGLLTTECDIIYECKVCRNLFRSLANFISHKRVYCKEMFNSNVHGHFIKSTSMVSELSKIKHVEDGYQDYIKNKSTLPPEVPLVQVPLSKDLTSVVESLSKNVQATEPVTKEEPMEISTQKIPSSSVAVFQNIKKNVGGEEGDEMCAEVKEIDKFVAKDSAIMKEDGKFETCVLDTTADKEVIQISDDDEASQLNCKLCDIQFSTRKTLKFHMKYKHVPDRLVYPCTDCSDIFATSWSVLRHLYRVHRKTLPQIRRMREHVQSKAFRMDNVPSSYIRRKNMKKSIVEEKLTEEERMDQENQAWMDNMETDSELPRCGGCGRSFERRAALAAHTHTCQSRTRALARRPNPQDKTVKKDAKVVAVKTDGVAKVVLPKLDMEDKEKQPEEEKPVVDLKQEMEVDKEPSEGEDAEVNDESDSESVKLNFPEELEKANMEALRKKMADFVTRSDYCRICKRKYSTPSHLCRHMASHFNWRRFGCKLCNFVNYEKNRLVGHAQTIHKLKGSEEFYTSIMRVVPPGEAMANSVTPSFIDEEWNEEDEESCDSDDVNITSGDESSSSQNIKQNRRKQTFKPVKVCKSKASSPEKDEDKSKKSSLIPLEKVMQVILGDNIKDKVKDNNQPENKEQTDTAEKSAADSKRPVRKRTRPKKDEDFEYDFSNVMKWEANSYKDVDNKSTASKSISTKRKSTADSSPSESSPEKNDKQEKVSVTDERPCKIGKIDEKKRSYAGALATMSDRAVSQFRAHLRPTSSFNPDKMMLWHVPFDVQDPNKKKTSSKLVVTKQLINRRKSFTVTPTSSSTQNNDTVKTEQKSDASTDNNEIENADEKRNVFKPTNIRTLVQMGKSSTDLNKQPLMVNKKQKVIVMKRVNSGSGNEVKQSCGTIRIKYQQKPTVIELKNPVTVPVDETTPKDSSEITTSEQLKVVNDELAPVCEESISNKADHPSPTDTVALA